MMDYNKLIGKRMVVKSLDHFSITFGNISDFEKYIRSPELLVMMGLLTKQDENYLYLTSCYMEDSEGNMSTEQETETHGILKSAIVSIILSSKEGERIEDKAIYEELQPIQVDDADMMNAPMDYGDMSEETVLRERLKDLDELIKAKEIRLRDKEKYLALKIEELRQREEEMNGSVK